MDDQSAFPHEGGHKFMQGNEVRKTLPSHGMTLRDYFAAKAMQALLTDDDEPYVWENKAKHAYRIADAMLKEREKLCSFSS